MVGRGGPPAGSAGPPAGAGRPSTGGASPPAGSRGRSPAVERRLPAVAGVPLAAVTHEPPAKVLRPAAVRHSPPAVRHTNLPVRHKPGAVRHKNLALRHSPPAASLPPAAAERPPVAASLPYRAANGPPAAADRLSTSVVCLQPPFVALRAARERPRLSADGPEVAVGGRARQERAPPRGRFPSPGRRRGPSCPFPHRKRAAGPLGRREGVMAERAGFEPARRLSSRRPPGSNRAPCQTRSPLQDGGSGGSRTHTVTGFESDASADWATEPGMVPTVGFEPTTTRLSTWRLCQGWATSANGAPPRIRTENLRLLRPAPLP